MRLRPLSLDVWVEIQYLTNGACSLIFFVDEVTTSQIARLNGNTGHSLMAALYPWGKMNTLVSLPANRILKSKNHDVQINKEELVTVLDLKIKQRKNNMAKIEN